MTLEGIETQLDTWALDWAIDHSDYFTRKREMRRRKLNKRKSRKMFAKGVLKQHPRNRVMTVRGGIRL